MGGVCGYVENSRRLLEEARKGENPFRGVLLSSQIGWM